MEEKRLTPIKAIRAKCLECSCDSKHEVKMCPITDCALYPYRMGHNPYIQRRELTDAERAKARERASLLQNRDR